MVSDNYGMLWMQAFFRPNDKNNPAFLAKARQLMGQLVLHWIPAQQVAIKKTKNKTKTKAKSGDQASSTK